MENDNDGGLRFHQEVGQQEEKEHIMGNKVYTAINAVQAALTAEGITKNRKNQQQGYSFRGIDDVYNALSPLLAKHGLCILPRMLAREIVERQSSSGKGVFFVTVEAEFDLVSSEDGSKHTVKTFGEAMDSGDKATNKAMSAAYKYMCFQTFAIPTEGDNDADAHTHVVDSYPISEEQVANIEALIDEVGADTEAFCKFMRIGSIKDLPLDQYSNAVHALEKKRNAKY